jgi:hypothetical protein
VLVGLAGHAGPDGTGAFPSVATLVRYTGLAERTVRTCLDRLAAADIIAPCDPAVVAARIKRADRRPQGWDLNLGLARDDLGDAAVAVLEHRFPGLRVGRSTAAGAGGERTSRRTGLPAPLRPRSFPAVSGEPRGDLLGAEPGPRVSAGRRNSCNEQGRCWHRAEGNY